MSEKFLLGIDNGGTVAKAAIVAQDGRELAVAACKTESLTPLPGWVEFDAEALWQATAAAVRNVIDKAGIAADKIAAVACTGHGNGLYLVDAEGRPVRNAIFSADARAREYVERWNAEGIDRAVRPQTMQSLWPGQPNALLAWLADHEPGVVSRTCWCLMCKDYTRMRLTGEAFAEQTDMSGTSLLDVGTGQYDAGLLEAFGIGTWDQKLPPLRLSTDLCGRVTQAAAELTGLRPGTPVAGGLFDIDACALSSALLDEQQFGMTFGTWGINQYVSPTPVVDNIFMTSRYCVPGNYLMLEGSATSAANLEWFLAQVFRRETRSAHEADLDPYAQVDAWVAQTAPGESGLLFLPFLYGSSVGADATGCLIGLSARTAAGRSPAPCTKGLSLATGCTWSDCWRSARCPRRFAPAVGPRGATCGCRWRPMCFNVQSKYPMEWNWAPWVRPCARRWPSDSTPIIRRPAQP